MAFRRTVRETVFIVCLSILGAVMVYWFHPNAPNWSDRSMEDGALSAYEVETFGDEVLWIDARTYEAYRNSTIPGAIWLSESEWELGFAQLLEVWVPEQVLVVFCDGGECQSSRAVMQRLRRELGVETVYYLRGGFPEWQRR